MSKISKEIIIKIKQGMHARPAAMFVQIASQYDADVIIRTSEEEVNGKSIMGLLTLGLPCDSKVVLEVDGTDAEKVLEELEKILLQEDI